MEKEQLGTRVDPSLGRRLRVYAAVNRRTVAEVVSEALDAHLPPLADLVSGAGTEVTGRDAVLAAHGGQVVAS